MPVVARDRQVVVNAHGAPLVAPRHSREVQTLTTTVEATLSWMV